MGAIFKFNPNIPIGTVIKEPNFTMFRNYDHVCIILRQPLGHFCGYVGVNKKSKCYGLEYYRFQEEDEQIESIQEDINNISVHGGLTYSKTELICVNNIFKDSHWFFGFDCAHYGDAKLYDILPFSSNETYRDYNYVKEQVINLSNQLKKIEEKYE